MWRHPSWSKRCPLSFHEITKGRQMEISLFQIRAAPSREWGLDKGVQLARPPGRETALLTSSPGLLGWSEPETFEIADDVQNRGARFTAAPPSPPVPDAQRGGISSVPAPARGRGRLEQPCPAELPRSLPPLSLWAARASHPQPHVAPAHMLCVECAWAAGSFI